MPDVTVWDAIPIHLRDHPLRGTHLGRHKSLQSIAISMVLPH